MLEVLEPRHAAGRVPCVASFLLRSFSSRWSGSACSNKIIIGVVLPETGDASAYGTSVKTGVKLAFDHAVAARTAPAGLEVVYQDTGSNPSRGADLADALYKRGALIVIGGATSPEAKVMTRVANKYGRILLSPSASAPDLTSKGGWFLRIYPSDEGEGVQGRGVPGRRIARPSLFS